MKIHFVGCNGVSMRALAAAALSRGHTVTGSDRTAAGHDPNNVVGADLVVYTNAVSADNCELVRAAELGIPVIERAEYLGELSKTYKTVIAVAGCHGKSTATAMLGAAFSSRNATVHVGAEGASHTGSSEYFITEACEYRASFLHLRPDIGIILNVQFDHPDFYADDRALTDAYRAFCSRCDTVIVNGDDERAAALLKGAVTFGLGKTNDYRAEDILNTRGIRSFTLSGNRRAAVRLNVPGEHNIYNALAAIAAADVCGLPLTETLAGLKAFRGLPRRFEYKGIAYGKAILTDYAHHPAEISATIKTAREMFGSVAVVFQPHTYTRTQSLLTDFAASLAAADTVILAPIYSARENPIPGITSQALCRIIAQKTERAYCFDTFAEILDVCRPLKENALIFMGAGDINRLAEKITSDGM